MTFLPAPLVRRKQPILPVGINWSHPVARKLSGAWNFVDGPVDTKDLTWKSSQFTVNTTIGRTRANTKFGTGANRVSSGYAALFSKSAGITTQSAIIFGRLSELSAALITNSTANAYLWVGATGKLILDIASAARATSGASIAIGDDICAGFNGVSNNDYQVFLNGRPESAIYSANYGAFGSIGSISGSVLKSGGIAATLLFDFHTMLTEQEHAMVYDNPWALLQPEVVTLFFSTVTAQFLRPISDVSNSGWTPSTGSDLFSCIGETVRNDSTYISATAPGAICEVLLGTSSGDPLSSINHLPRIVMSAGTGGIVVRLKQGATLIKAWTYASLAATDTLYEPTLTSGEIDAITDYTNLRLELETTA